MFFKEVAEEMEEKEKEYQKLKADQDLTSILKDILLSSLTNKGEKDK